MADTKITYDASDCSYIITGEDGAFLKRVPEEHYSFLYGYAATRPTCYANIVSEQRVSRWQVVCAFIGGGSKRVFSAIKPYYNMLKRIIRA